MFQPVGFDFDANPGTFVPEPLNSRGQPGYTLARIEMIIFHQDHLAQGRAMILAPARDDRGLLQGPQTRRRLPCIENLRARFADRFHELPGQRGDAGQALEEI